MSKKSSQRTQKTSRSRENCSQSQLSQSRLDEHFGPQLTTEDQVNNCVRYIVNNMGHTAVFPRNKFQKMCACKAGQRLQQIINDTTSVLKNVYGYNLILNDGNTNSGKVYIASNAMPPMCYDIQNNHPSNKQIMNTLLLLILSHIFMEIRPCTEDSLLNFLRKLNIDVDERDPNFGIVKQYITFLIKQKYLSSETDPVSKKVTLTWGVRAEKEISKHEILKFVSKICKRTNPKSWEDHFKLADEQGFENERILETESMEVDELSENRFL